jgi:hypothetical protein
VFYVCDGIVTDKKSKPEDYNALAHVAETCKQWDLLVRNRVEHHYPQAAVKNIGRGVWQELGANVGEVPRFPLIFYPDVASGEFILTWIPEYLKGKPMRDPKTIDEFCKGKQASIYRVPLSGIAAETSKPFKGHWFLMSVDVLKGTRGESFAEQEQMVKGAGYEMAHMIGAITSILLHRKRTGECLYPDGSVVSKEPIRGYKSTSIWASNSKLLLAAFPLSTSASRAAIATALTLSAPLACGSPLALEPLHMEQMPIQLV